MKLLDKARSFDEGKHRKYFVDDEMIDFAIAYLEGELTDRQVAYALGYKTKYPAPIKSKLMTILKNAVIQGKVEVEKI